MNLVIGLFIGYMLGIATMCILFVAREIDKESEIMEMERKEVYDNEH